MQETVGTLDLKIARLERYLNVLKQQQAMSRMYPGHQAHLVREDAQMRAQLRQLIRCREELLQQVNGNIAERLPFNEHREREESFCSTY